MSEIFNDLETLIGRDCGYLHSVFVFKSSEYLKRRRFGCGVGLDNLNPCANWEASYHSFGPNCPLI